MTTEVFWEPSFRKTIIWSSVITIVVASVKVSVHHLEDFITWFRTNSDVSVHRNFGKKFFFKICDTLKVVAAASYQFKLYGW